MRGSAVSLQHMVALKQLYGLQGPSHPVARCHIDVHYTSIAQRLTAIVLAVLRPSVGTFVGAILRMSLIACLIHCALIQELGT
jgi:hypothetical protein